MTRDRGDLLGEWTGGTVGCETCDWRQDFLERRVLTSAGICQTCAAPWSYTPSGQTPLSLKDLRRGRPKSSGT